MREVFGVALELEPNFDTKRSGRHVERDRI